MSSSNNPLDPLRKSQEEEYFRKQNAEMAAKLKGRLSMKEAGIEDPELADALTRAGYTADSVRALFLVPLFEVALADHNIQPEEKTLLWACAQERGIEKTSEAHRILEDWVRTEGDAESFLRAKQLLGPLLEEVKREQKEQWLLDAAERIATAAGGLFGLGMGAKKSKAEAALVERLEKKLKP